MRRKARRVETDSKRLRDRALWCRQLAKGAGDLQFTIKLNALSEEYEGGAELEEARAIGSTERRIQTNDR